MGQIGNGRYFCRTKGAHLHFSRGSYCNPLQITALITHRERLVKSDRISLALSRVGQDVCDAVQKFVHIGENIAEENAEITQDMLEACREAREAGT